MDEVRLLLLDRPCDLALFHMKSEFSIVKKNPDIVYTQLTPVSCSVPVFCPCTGIEHIKAPKIVNLYDKEWLEWNVRATAEHTFALILGVAKNLARHYASGEVERSENTPMSEDLFGKNILIVGNGRVGRQVGRLARAFGMNVDTVEQGYNFDIIRHKLNQSDIVTFHIPLNAETEGMVGNEWFKEMKDNAIVVNTSRSAIFDEAFLIRYSRKLRFAIDVAETYSQNTLDGFRCDITPHVGGYSRESREKTDMWILDKMIEYKERHK